jgi:hypothetical protein
VAHAEALLRLPDPGGPLPSHTALDDVFEMKRPYRGGLSIDYPFHGDNILLMSRVSQQGASSKTQEGSHPPQFTPMELDGRSEELGKLPFHSYL